LTACLLTTTALGAATAVATVPAHAAGASRPVYVAHLLDNSVGVLDPATGALTSTIPVGSFPFDLAVSPDGSTLYTANASADTVSVVSTATGTVTDTVTVGDGPNAVAVSPDGTQIYASYFVTPGTFAIAVISAATDTVTARINVGNQAVSIAFTPDGSRAYVANYIDDSVSVIDTATQTVTATIGLPSTPEALAVTPDGTAVYVAEYNNSSVQVISTATNTVTTTITAGAYPSGMAISPDGTKAYTALSGAGSLAVIDTATNTVSSTVPVGAGPTDAVVDPAGTTVYVANSSDNTVSVVDTATGTVISTSAVGNVPYALAIAPAPPAVSSISPASGLSAGGGTVTITGIHLSGAGAVSFGGTPATAVHVVNDYTVTATIPAHAGGTVDVTVTTPAGTSATGPGDQYTYYAVPTVTSVSPASGPQLGGNTVTITGTNLSGATVIDFNGGGGHATTFSCTTSTTCTAVVPSWGVGPTHVLVTTPGGTSVPSAGSVYTYIAAPTVASVSPNTGSTAGGNTVTVTGTDLTGATISFGATSATAVSCTATSCTVTAPAHAAGTVDVKATTPGGTSATSAADHYTYAAADLAVTLAATGVPGLGGHIDYTLTVTNNGPSALASASVTATLPWPMNPTSGDCTATGNVVCIIGSLASGASTTRHFTAPIGLLTLGTPYAVTATRTTSTPADLNPANDSATRNCTVLTSLIITCT
jgi:YVTN family beta-propeller protein